MSKKYTVTLSQTVFYTTNVEAETIADAFSSAVDKVRHTSTWDGTKFDQRMLSRGVIHLTKEAAIKHAEALLSFTEKAG